MSKVRSDIGIEKFYRILSKKFVKKIEHTNINFLFFMVFFFLIISSVPFIILSKDIYSNLISFILINLSLIMDCADGDLARKKNAV